MTQPDPSPEATAAAALLYPGEPHRHNCVARIIDRCFAERMNELALLKSDKALSDHAETEMARRLMR